MLTVEQQRRLNENLPTGVVRERQGFSYVEGWYVIDRLNDILGPGGWSYDTETTMVVSKQRLSKSGNEQWAVTYTAKCVLTVGDCKIGDHGAGHGIDASEGNAHESAIKEACTDALKRAAKSLGRSMGLALYDKEKSHLVEAAANTPSAADVAMVRAALGSAQSQGDLDKAIELYKKLKGMDKEQDSELRKAGSEARKRIAEKVVA